MLYEQFDAGMFSPYYGMSPDIREYWQYIENCRNEGLKMLDQQRAEIESLRRENAELKKLIEDANDILARYISSRDLGDE